MPNNERKTGRADHATRGDQDADSNQTGAKSAGQPNDDRTIGDAAANDSADRRGHGAHGKGRDEEKVQDETPTQPDRTAGSDRGGSGGWGSEASGGSVIDKRSPKRR